MRSSAAKWLADYSRIRVRLRRDIPVQRGDGKDAIGGSVCAVDLELSLPNDCTRGTHFDRSPREGESDPSVAVREALYPPHKSGVDRGVVVVLPHHRRHLSLVVELVFNYSRLLRSVLGPVVVHEEV